MMVVDENGDEFYENGDTNDDDAFKVILIMIMMVIGHDGDNSKFKRRMGENDCYNC